MQLFVGDGKRPFKVAHLYRLLGKDTVEVDELLPGDIGAVAKVDEIEFDCVLHDSHDEDHIHLVPLEFPKPMAGLAVETKKKGDEQRLFDILGKLAMEDPTFIVERHPTSNETVIRGLGEIHLKTKLEKMAGQYKLEVDTKPPRIPYRETITGPAEGMHRHKKQSAAPVSLARCICASSRRGVAKGSNSSMRSRVGSFPACSWRRSKRASARDWKAAWWRVMRSTT